MIIKAKIGLIAALALGATPALANEATTATQISGAIESDVAGTGDEEFRALFTSWEELDDGGRINAEGEIVAAPALDVSIPSRLPIEDNFRVSSEYGMRNHPILRQRRHHNGVDLAAPRGTPVYATADGIVGQAEWFSSYGRYVRIEHGGELHTRYAHLSRYTVAVGDVVRKGDLIGYVGSTGRSTGPHLHYEVRVSGESVDPIPYMFASYDTLGVEEAEGGMGGE